MDKNIKWKDEYCNKVKCKHRIMCPYRMKAVFVYRCNGHTESSPQVPIEFQLA